MSLNNRRIHMRITQELALVTTLSLVFAGSAWAQEENERSPSYDRFDFNVTWTAPSEMWSVSVFAHNVFNEQEVELFEIDGFEFEDPSSGEEVFLPVDNQFVSGWRYWGSEIRYRF